MPRICPHCGKSIDIPALPSGFSEAVVSRFWSKVNKGEDCWTTSTLPSAIYGRISINNRLILTHVVSWIIANGAVPEGKKVCHKCDNPRCVRPDHLFLGTNSENMIDMVSKGRNNPNPTLKITGDQVLYIRDQLAQRRKTIQQLATELGVSFQSVWQIGMGRSRASFGPPVLKRRNRVFLSVESVHIIRRMQSSGIKQTEIAKQFGIHQATVSNIARGVKRKDVPFAS